MIVTGIQDLKVWQTDRDAALIEAMVDAAEAVHPEADLSLRAIKLVASDNVSICDLCNAPEFMVRDKGTGITGPMCRMCINAIRRQSLTHVQYTAEICWDCSITTDSVGLISGANHHPFPFNDEVQSNGSIRRGLIPYITAGRVDLTNDILTLLPEV